MPGSSLRNRSSVVARWRAIVVSSIPDVGEPFDRAGDEPPASLPHPVRGRIVVGPGRVVGGGTKGHAQIPIREPGGIDIGIRQRRVVSRELLHGPGAERPQELEPGAADVGEQVADLRVLPVDDRGETAILPQDVSGPEIAMEQDRRVPGYPDAADASAFPRRSVSRDASIARSRAQSSPAAGPSCAGRKDTVEMSIA